MKETARERKQREKWEADEDLRHLREAEAIKRDKKRYSRAMKMAQDEMKALSAVGAGKPKKRRPGSSPMTEDY